MLPRAPGIRPIRGRCLHNRRVLVHSVNVFRQSRCHDREDVKRHVRGDSTLRCPLFILAQILGALAATFLFRWLVPSLQLTAKEVLVAHESDPPTIALDLGVWYEV